VDDIFFFFLCLFAQIMMMMLGISGINKQTHTQYVGFPLTFKNYNLFEAREARDEIIL